MINTSMDNERETYSVTTINATVASTILKKVRKNAVGTVTLSYTYNKIFLIATEEDMMPFKLSTNKKVEKVK